jgi:hypothetical protein
MTMRNRIWLGMCLTGILAGVPATSAAMGPPLRVDAGINWRFNVYLGPAAQPFGSGLAPWYAYFPADAPLQAAAPAGLYPTWPTPWPPRSAAPQSSPPPAVPLPVNPYTNPPTGVRPASYSYPSYWYAQ